MLEGVNKISQSLLSSSIKGSQARKEKVRTVKMVLTFYILMVAMKPICYFRSNCIDYYSIL